MKTLKTTLKAWPLIALITVALCYLTGLVAEFVFGVKLDNQASLEQVRAMITWMVRRLCSDAGWRWRFFKDIASLLWIIAWLVVIVPVLEEVVFRWLLWKLPKPKWPVISAVTSSVLFSAAHYIQMPWPNNAFIALFFFGMAQCWLYKKTERLWSPMLNHSLFNMTNLVLLFILPEA